MGLDILNTQYSRSTLVVAGRLCALVLLSQDASTRCVSLYIHSLMQSDRPASSWLTTIPPRCIGEQHVLRRQSMHWVCVCTHKAIHVLLVCASGQYS